VNTSTTIQLKNSMATTPCNSPCHNSSNYKDRKLPSKFVNYCGNNSNAQEI